MGRIDVLKAKQTRAQEVAPVEIIPDKANAAMHAHASRALVSAGVLPRAAVPTATMVLDRNTGQQREYVCTALGSKQSDDFMVDTGKSIQEGREADEDTQDEDDDLPMYKNKPPVTACQRLQADLVNLEQHIYEQSARRLQQLQRYKEQVNKIFVQEAKRLGSTAGYGYESVDMMELNETTEALEQDANSKISASPGQSYLDIMRQARVVAEGTPQK